MSRMDRRDETRIVKKALKQEGIKAKVSHGNGTGYGWIEVNLGDPVERNGIEKHPNGWSTRYTTTEMGLHEKVIKLVQDVTGRHGKYNGNISLLAQ